MNIAIVGTGYVGLVAGACFAETGHHVICVDKDASKIEMLCNGKLPIYELGLDDLYHNNVHAGRLSFTGDLAEAVRQSDTIFMAVGTPPMADGSADLSDIWATADEIADAMDHPCLVVVKSTVPVGTTEKIRERIAVRTDQPFDIANNPEFLKEGLAIDDFNKPDRIVVGVEKLEVGERLTELYAPFQRSGCPMIVTNTRTSELTKYAANAMLATKISFINEIANICEVVGADVEMVRKGICSDKRIGMAFMFPGIGYGGSCFPKDVPALIRVAEQHGVEPHLLRAVDEVNAHQAARMARKIRMHFGGDLAGRTLAVWGASYKAGTSDVRVSPSIVVIERLLDLGMAVRLHDPRAMESARDRLGDRVMYCEDGYEALDGADALMIGTDWREYRSPDFDQVRERLASSVIFDGRNLYGIDQMQWEGFTYYGIGHGLPESAVAERKE